MQRDGVKQYLERLPKGSPLRFETMFTMQPFGEFRNPVLFRAEDSFRDKINLLAEVEMKEILGYRFVFHNVF